MSAIENLIRALRYYQNVSEIGYSEKFAVNEVCRDAADIIESLSAKLQAANEELERWHTDKINEKIRNSFAWTSTLCCCNCDHKDEYIEELEAEIEELKAANMERQAEDCDGWIPCKERLPENYQDVLVSGKDIVKQAQFINGVFECEDPDFYAMLDDEKIIGCEDTTFKALAWQPLSESYHEP